MLFCDFFDNFILLFRSCLWQLWSGRGFCSVGILSLCSEKKRKDQRRVNWIRFDPYTQSHPQSPGDLSLLSFFFFLLFLYYNGPLHRQRLQSYGEHHRWGTRRVHRWTCDRQKEPDDGRRKRNKQSEEKDTFCVPFPFICIPPLYFRPPSLPSPFCLPLIFLLISCTWLLQLLNLQWPSTPGGTWWTSSERQPLISQTTQTWSCLRRRQRKRSGCT